MKVKLINHTPEPDMAVAAAARLCYSSVGAEQIMDEFAEDDIERVPDMVILKFVLRCDSCC